jgi:hypothetical protein
MPSRRDCRATLRPAARTGPRSAGIGGLDRDLDAELVGARALPPHPEPVEGADTLDLRGVEGIELPVPLALPLRADLGGPRQRALERRRNVLPPHKLAADIAEQATQAGAQEAQLAMVAVELFGVGVAAGHHRRPLGEAEIGLPQPHAVAGTELVGVA